MNRLGWLAACALSLAPAAAVVRMPKFFGDGMVLQSNFESGVRAFLNGWAAPGELVVLQVCLCKTENSPPP
jgi:hypothetical protein